MSGQASASSSLHRVVVIGGGASGLELVTRLGGTLGRRGRLHVTLVDRARTHLWKPLLHAVAAGSIDRAQHELNYLAQAHWHRFSYRYGELTGIDRDSKQIHLAAAQDDEGREITPPGTLRYDTLVVAIGSVTNDFGTPGAARYAIPLETPEQASRFHRRLVNACLQSTAPRTAPITPGPTARRHHRRGCDRGTELAGELHQTARDVIAYGMDQDRPQSGTSRSC